MKRGKEGGFYLNLGGGGVKAGTIFLQQTNGPITRGCTLCFYTLKGKLVMTVVTDKFTYFFIYRVKPSFNTPMSRFKGLSFP